MADPAPRALPTGTRLLLTAASAVVVIAGLKAASAVVIPTMLAAVLALMCYLPMKALQRRRLPPTWSIVVVFVVASVILLGVIAVVGSSIVSFQDRIAQLDVGWDEQLDKIVAWFAPMLDRLGVAREDFASVKQVFNPKQLLQVVSVATNQLLDVLSNLFVVGFLMVFMLGEANGFSAKVARAAGASSEALEHTRQLKDRIASYLSIKTVISLATGIIIGVFTMSMGLDSPVLWGFLAFAFNFIPNIGSIIAAIPAVLMALIVNGWANAIGVAVGYAVVNTVIGSVVEPRVMGRSLGLSTLVVFLSLLFWSWVFGPIGMLLSVPLTVAVKIFCEHVEDLRPVAVLLGSASADEST